MEVVFKTDITGHVEQDLDAIHVPDDADETLSLIWVQCRRCKWACSVESYTVGECACNLDLMQNLETEIDMLNMEDNILNEDYARWSDHSEPEEYESVQCDSTDEEHSDTSTDELPSLIDDEEGSEHDENEVQKQMDEVVITLPYVDNMIIYDPMELDDVRNGTTCVMCNLTYDGSYDDHAEECCMHGYCTIHRRWEGVRHGRIKCDLDGYNPRYDRDSMSRKLPTPEDVPTDMYQRPRTASDGYTE